jgi:hypothetical protein
MIETTAMADATIDALTVDLLTWLESRERPYQEVLDAWRTSCPKLPVWEDANDRGLVTRVTAAGGEFIRVTPAGIQFLHEHRRAGAPGTPQPE